MEFDVYKICRLCQTELIDVDHRNCLEDVELIKWIADLYGVKINQLDNYSTNICSTCETKVMEFTMHSATVKQTQVKIKQQILKAKKLNDVKQESNTKEVKGSFTGSGEGSVLADGSNKEVLEDDRTTISETSIVANLNDFDMDETSAIASTSNPTASTEQPSNSSNARNGINNDEAPPEGPSNVNKNVSDSDKSANTGTRKRTLRNKRSRSPSVFGNHDVSDHTPIPEAKKIRINGMQDKPRTNGTNNASSVETTKSKSNKTRSQPAASTPLKSKPENAITSYFPKANFKCDMCDTQPLSQQESEFHKDCHKNRRCRTCDKDISNGKVKQHVITCLWLNNEIPHNEVQYMMDCAVSVKKFTRDDIQNILKSAQLKMSSPSTSRSVFDKENKGDNNVENEESIRTAITCESADTDASLNKRKEHRKKEKEQKQAIKLPKAFKSLITQNTSVPIYWHSDQFKGRMFMLKDFEREPIVYTLVESSTRLSASNAKFISDICKKMKRYTVEKPVDNHSPDHSCQTSSIGTAVTSPRTTSHVTSHATSSVATAVTFPKTTSHVTIHATSSITTAVTSPRTTSHANVSSTTSNAHVSKSNVQVQKPFEKPSSRNRSASPEPRCIPIKPKPIPSRRKTICFEPNLSATSLYVYRDHTYSNGTNQFSQPNQATMADKAQQKVQQTQSTFIAPMLPRPDYVASIPRDSPVYQHLSLNAAPNFTKLTLQPNALLKVLSPDQLNLRADSSQFRPGSENAIVENNNNRPNPVLNRACASPQALRNVHKSNIRRKFSPIRPELHRSESKPQPRQQVQQQEQQQANDSISIALCRLGNDNQLELTMTRRNNRIHYNDLNEKDKADVTNCLLQGEIWRQMLNHMKYGRPTYETIELFDKLLPAAERQQFSEQMYPYTSIR